MAKEHEPSWLANLKRNRFVAVLAALAATLIIAGGVAAVPGEVQDGYKVFESSGDGTSPPPKIALSAIYTFNQCAEHVRPGAIPKGSVQFSSPDQVAAWAKVNNSADANSSQVQLNIASVDSRPIVITDIHVNVVHRQKVSGFVFTPGDCGGPLSGRYIAFDLDASPPRVTHSSDTDNDLFGPDGEPAGAAPQNYKPLKFPYSASANDPLQVFLIASTKKCDCTWTADVLWQSGSAHGTEMITDGGKPFHTSGVDGLQNFEPNQSGLTVP